MAHTANIRPISFVSDLGFLIFVGWTLAKLSSKYSGSAQAGGKFEALIMALGLITAAQERRKLGSEM